MTLPRYIVDHSGSVYAIWDTKEHEYTGFEYEYSPEGKEEAQRKCDSINKIESAV